MPCSSLTLSRQPTSKVAFFLSLGNQLQVSTVGAVLTAPVISFYEWLGILILCMSLLNLISFRTLAQARLRAELKHISKRSEKKLTRIPLLAASEQGPNQRLNMPSGMR